MASSELYTVHVTGDQLEAVSQLFITKGWQLQVDEKGSRYLAMKDVADDYIDMRVLSNSEGNFTDRSQRSFKDMKKTAETYKSLNSSIQPEAQQLQVNEDPTVMRRKNERKGTWRLSTWDPEFKGHVKSEINLKHFCVVEDNMLKVITSLDTGHIHQISQVPVRIVLLVDRSGSMLTKLGKGGVHSKITKVKHFAKQLINSLDDGDEAALVTFGKEAEIFFPLTKLTVKSRPYLMEMLNKLDKGGMSQETNLSDGLRMALKAFYNAIKDQAGYLSRKNSIIVFSDGEINSGTVEPRALVHEVRQNIRQMVPNLDDSQNQWVTISVVTTGNAVSEQAYMLSKYCSSDAFYYIDSDAEDPEAELFIPVLLRKVAVAWNISLLVEVFNELSFVDEKCTQDFRVRLRRSVSGKGRKSEKAYFLYDFPIGHSREIGVCFDIDHHSHLESMSEETKLVQLRVEYTNIKGERLWQEKVIRAADVMEAKGNPINEVALDAVQKHDIRIVTTDIFHAAAEQVRGGDRLKCKSTLFDGQNDIKAMLERFGTEAQMAESKTGPEVTIYAKSVIDNLSALIDCIDNSTNAGSWNKIKAVSTAIARETPNVTDTVKDGDVLCPLPEIEKLENKGLTDALEKLEAKQGKQKRVTFGGLDRFLEETLT